MTAAVVDSAKHQLHRGSDGDLLRRAIGSLNVHATSLFEIDHAHAGDGIAGVEKMIASEREDGSPAAQANVFQLSGATGDA